jgi:hypothetical protein
MTTLIIFAALIYLIDHLGLEAKVHRVLNLVLAIAGIVLWVAACLGVALPACFRT